MTVFYNRICLKIRNVGASMVMIAAEAVLTCWLYPNIFIPFVSATETQANDLIGHCKNVIKFCGFEIDLNGPLENQTKTTVLFANGSTIRSFAGGNPQGIRGPRAMVAYLDEFAFVSYPQEVLSAVEYFLSEGGQLNVLSTPFGKQNRFWQIYADRENYSGWHRHYVSLFTDMNNFDVRKNLIDQMSKNKLVMTCPWLNLQFLEDKRASDAPFGYVNFLQESCGVAVDEVTAVITETLLDTNSMESYYMECRPLMDDGRKNMDRIFIMSIDFGADNNNTAIVLFEAKDGRLVVCYTETFRGDFMEQVGKVRNIFLRFEPTYTIGDETGMGGKSWISLLSAEAKDGAIIGVNYSKKDIAAEYGVDMNNKNFFITTMIRLIGEGMIVTPKNHRRLREEILGLQKIVYEKTVKYSGKNGPAGGDDLAMAYMQASLLFNRIYEFGEGESNSFADSNIGLSKANKAPRFGSAKQVDNIEIAGAKKELPSRVNISGFDKLI
jgi:hypothetical protein